MIKNLSYRKLIKKNISLEKNKIPIYVSKINMVIDISYFNNLKKKIILKNCENSSKIIGMRIIDRYFEMLNEKFPSLISYIEINVRNNKTAAIRAIKLGYKNIQHQINSKQLKFLIENQ